MEKIINFVHTHPCLYDKNHPNYKKRVLKQRLWREIGKTTNNSAEKAKKMWKNLRDSYMKHRKEVNDTTGKMPKKYINWRWASKLAFLDHTLFDQDASPNIVCVSDMPSQELQSDPPSPCSSMSLPYVNPIEDGPLSPKKIKTDDSLPDNAPEPAKSSASQQDAVDYLFQSYAKTFRTFSKHNQITLKLELANMFANYESKEVEDNHYYISHID